jgi:hypothetical protein
MKDRSSHNQNLVDQYTLVHCGLAAVCKTKLHPDIWHESSFVSTNTKPNKMTEFTECGVKRLRDTCRVLTPMTFSKNMNVNKEYTLLPVLWQAMLPAEKWKSVDIVLKHDKNAWGLERCQELLKELSIPFKDLLTVLQPCIFCAIKDPSHVDRGMEDDDAPSQEEGSMEVIAAEATRKSANELCFSHAHPIFKEEALFDHSIEFMHHQYAKKEDEFKISAYLNDASPANKQQKDLLRLDYHLKMKGSLMDNVKTLYNAQRN